MKEEAMQNEPTIGKNRTGIAMSPIDAPDVTQMAAESSLERVITEEELPQMEDAAALRQEYAEESDPLGSRPPPANVKGAVKTGVSMFKGVDAAVFLDKLGERLAFERTGTRLYGAFLNKVLGSPPMPGGPTAKEVQNILQEELAHFHMLLDVMEEMGGDPTAITPSADVAAVTSMGLPQLINDPRATVKQCLEAILVAELVDNDGWALLVSLAEKQGNDRLVERFAQAYAEEEVHLARAREWATESTLREFGGEKVTEEKTAERTATRER